MDSPTVEDARSRKRELERTVADLIKEYEKTYGVPIERVSLDRYDTAGEKGSVLSNVEIEVKI